MYSDVPYERETGAFPPAVKWLLTANILVFVAQMLRGEFMGTWFALWPNFVSPDMPAELLKAYGIQPFYPWQIVTYGFLHSTGSFMHILFNMMGLWMFGKAIEQTIGTKRFVIYYFVCLVGAALMHLAYAHVSGSPFPVIGASGAIFGLLLAYGIMFPRNELYVFLIPFPIQARYFVIIYGVLELLLGVSNMQSSVAHFAHLGGMFFGFFLIQFWRGGFPFRGRRRIF